MSIVLALSFKKVVVTFTPLRNMDPYTIDRLRDAIFKNFMLNTLYLLYCEVS